MVSFKEFLLLNEEIEGSREQIEKSIKRKLDNLNIEKDTDQGTVDVLLKNIEYCKLFALLKLYNCLNKPSTDLLKQAASRFKNLEGAWLKQNDKDELFFSFNAGPFKKIVIVPAKIDSEEERKEVFTKIIKAKKPEDFFTLDSNIKTGEEVETIIGKIDEINKIEDEDKKNIERIRSEFDKNNKISKDDFDILNKIKEKYKNDDDDNDHDHDHSDEEGSLNGENGENGKKDPENDGAQVSSSNTSSLSSSFSEDDWETLFKEKNEAKIEKILNKVAGNTISKMEKMLNDRASQVLKDKDLMEEDAQEELWNIINEKINLGNGSYLERDKGKSVNMYKDGSVGKNDDGSINAGNANKTFEHYKQEIEYMTSNVAGRIAEINGSRSFNSSNGKLNKLRNQVRSVVLDYHNELLDIKNEFDKKISKVGLFQRNKINKARQKEKDDERFNSSEQGEMYGSALKEKTNQIYNAFNSTLKRSQVKTFDDMVAKQIATLAASSVDAKSFAKSCMFKRVLTEDGKTMFVLKYLSNKGIKIPLFDGKDHKQSGLDAKAYSDAFNKFKQELADNEKYNNDSVIKNLVDAINKETPQNKANTEGLDTEANLIRKALKRDQPQDENNDQSTEGENSQNNNSENNDKFKLPNGKFPETPEEVDELLKTGRISQEEANNIKEDIKKRDPVEIVKQKIAKARMAKGSTLSPDELSKIEGFDELTKGQQEKAKWGNTTVTTKSCDGLPIGARRYSRAIRRRMNYALNKYM